MSDINADANSESAYIRQLIELIELKSQQERRKDDSSRSTDGNINDKRTKRRTSKESDATSLSAKSSNAYTLTSGRAADAQFYHRDRLNADQRNIFDYVLSHPGRIVLVQAGPGTGKTFTMLAIAQACTKPVKVVIYKRDLLIPFRHCAVQYTVAKFCMMLFDLNFMAYKALDKQLASNVSVEELIISIGGLLRLALKNIAHTVDDCEILIIDEHTLIPKIIMFVILLICRIRPLTLIISGDRNQLQNIHNSIHARGISSYEIIESFADRVFSLRHNERCTDSRYSALVDYASKFSSSKKLDEFAYAFVSAIFYDRLTIDAKITDTHLASCHKTLTETVMYLTMNNQIPVSFYYIYATPQVAQGQVRGVPSSIRGLYNPDAFRGYFSKEKSCPKFLPYLPLVIGGRYFVQTFSENSIATLIYFDQSNIGNEEVHMKTSQNEILKFKKGDCRAVMFEEHVNYILNGGDEASDYVNTRSGRGLVYNFPIYPANVMSIHMCQGRTINNDIDLMLENCSYEQLYVAFSRVTQRSKFSRVRIYDTLTYLFSTIINFKKLALEPLSNLDVTDIVHVFNNHYTMYDLGNCKPDLIQSVQVAVTMFLCSRDVGMRCFLREKLIGFSKYLQRKTLTAPEGKGKKEKASGSSTLEYLLKNKSIFYPLALMNPPDVFVWVREYLIRNTALKNILSISPYRGRIRMFYTDDVDRGRATLESINNTSFAYANGETTVDYLRRIYSDKNHSTPNIQIIDANDERFNVNEESEKVTFLDYSCLRIRTVIKLDEKDSDRAEPLLLTRFSFRVIEANSSVNESWLLKELREFVNDSLSNERERNSQQIEEDNSFHTANRDVPQKRKIETYDDILEEVLPIKCVKNSRR
ncbi:unnamed protein product [Bemisia tabaci]|uniref:AAA+ ATPase domain-containing protein n=1 Tax=Bemisia tabaci TaxID=7038 RepID=A0A9P0ALV9_BEMTA|nr:unnamed protein product [Bemisia tabaci]